MADPAKLVPDTVNTEVFYRWGFPCCCVTTGSEFVESNPQDFLVNYKSEFCGLGPSFGGGYVAYLINWRLVAKWGYERFFCCLFPCCAVNRAFVSTNIVDEKLNFMLPPSEQDTFVARMAKFTGQHRAHAPGQEREWTFRSICNPCLLWSAKINPNKSLTFGTTSSGCMVLERRQHAWADDIVNVSAASAGICCAILGAPSSVAVTLGSASTMASYIVQGESEEAAKAFAEASAGGPLSAPLRVIEGDDGIVEIGPQWTKLTRKNCTLFCSNLTAGVCDVNEVVVFKTSQVAYLKSSLESWQPYFFACLQSMFCIQNEARKRRNIPGFTIMLPVCIVLWLLEVLACLNQALCRRTRIVFGGSGVNSEIHFPVATAPEVQLRDYAATIAQANSGGSKDAGVTLRMEEGSSGVKK